MLKLIKFLTALAGMLLIVCVGIGYLANPVFDSRTDVVISATPAKVFTVIGDPRAAAKWFPGRLAQIDRVELHEGNIALKAGESLMSAIGLGTENSGDLQPTHTYLLENGQRIDVSWDRYTPGKVTVERVVGGDARFLDMFETLSWGFEIAPVANEPEQSRLTVIASGEARKPFGNFLSKAAQALGLIRSQSQAIAARIEKLANA